ncbi:hypothetical protein, partial [Streptomonospora salina]
TPVLAGGADLVDSTATLISYSDPEGGPPREVLLASVDEQAEAKLMEALELQKTEPIHVEEEVSGRLPLDEEKQLYELTAKAAKSVNHKLKTGTAVPEHTKEYLAQAQAAVQEVLDSPFATADELEMAGYYKNWLGKVEHTIDTAGAGSKPYADVKIPTVQAYEQQGTATVTAMVPAEPEGTGLPTESRTAGRIQAAVDAESGTTSWNGSDRVSAEGTEYAVDLGDGWSAVYRPYQANDPAKTEYSLRGQLEVHAPQGAGHGKKLVSRLGDLNLVNRALTAKEGEWTYLMNNLTAQGLQSEPQVKTALGQAEELEEMQLQEIFHSQAHKAAGLDEHGLAKLAKSWQVEAAASCLPRKVALVRDAAAKAAGFADGGELAASPGYDPVPRSSGGWLTWSRWDVGNSAAMETAWSGKSLTHSIGAGSMSDLLATGVLASTERRSVMGVSSDIGMSENADKKSGGANSVFTRVTSQAAVTQYGLGKGAHLVWDDPPRLLDNTSVYGYPSDHFGAVNPKGNHSMHAMTKDPKKMAEFTAHNNEVMFRHGLDLLGAEAPSRIVCSGEQEKKNVVALLNKRGITHLAGKPIDQVVQA